MFKPKSFVCMWCGARHYKGSKVARYHAKMLKKYANKTKPKTSKTTWQLSIYIKPYKINYGFWTWKNRYFIEINRHKKGKYISVKRMYFTTFSMMQRKLKKVKALPHYYTGK